jgi:hypothetical protein
MTDTDRKRLAAAWGLPNQKDQPLAAEWRLLSRLMGVIGITLLGCLVIGLFCLFIGVANSMIGSMGLVPFLLLCILLTR